ncbi:hypothetical protein [Streptomyces sp. NPDC056983]|uniref:hypothetical protein n=1 Tax=Streptomyces sp. NPDC056983 TaxID=3345987 RepID=UPI003642EF85
MPDHQRTLSVAIAALAWGLASLFALRGLRLVPSIHIFNAAPTIKPELHLPHQKDHGLDDVADAVQRRPRPVPDRPPRSTSQAPGRPCAARASQAGRRHQAQLLSPSRGVNSWRGSRRSWVC